MHRRIESATDEGVNQSSETATIVEEMSNGPASALSARRGSRDGTDLGGSEGSVRQGRWACESDVVSDGRIHLDSDITYRLSWMDSEQSQGAHEQDLK